MSFQNERAVGARSMRLVLIFTALNCLLVASAFAAPTDEDPSKTAPNFVILKADKIQAERQRLRSEKQARMAEVAANQEALRNYDSDIRAEALTEMANAVLETINGLKAYNQKADANAALKLVESVPTPSRLKIWNPNYGYTVVYAVLSAVLLRLTYGAWIADWNLRYPHALSVIESESFFDRYELRQLIEIGQWITRALAPAAATLTVLSAKKRADASILEAKNWFSRNRFDDTPFWNVIQEAYPELPKGRQKRVDFLNYEITAAAEKMVAINCAKRLLGE